MSSNGKAGYRGRYAPSPRGRLHFGSARTALIAWLRARSLGGTFVLRMEDLDPPRVMPGAAQAICDDLRWLGLDWDEGPDVGGAFGPYTQSERNGHYQTAVAQLEARGLLYPCTCSRKEIAAMVSAPHGDEGPPYPGSCRNGPRHPGRPAALRFRVDHTQSLGFTDKLCGRIGSPAQLDDFPVRRADGLFAYQLAVVVDDIAMGITEVVRGDDLLSSTPRQIALYRAFDAQRPAFLHVPLVLGHDGLRLSKRHGSIAIADFRNAGWPAERLLGELAASLHLIRNRRSIAPSDLLDAFAVDRISLQPYVLLQDACPLLGS